MPYSELVEHYSDRTLHMMVGLPYSGKSTIALGLGALLQSPVLSYQKVVEAICGGAIVSGVSQRIKEVVYDTIGWYLHNGITLVFDADNILASERQEILGIAKAMRFRCVAIWVRCSEDESFSRMISSRGNPFVYEEAKRKFEPPQMREGFDAVLMLDTDIRIPLTEPMPRYISKPVKL